MRRNSSRAPASEANVPRQADETTSESCLRTPLATMLEDGLQGIIAVRKHLDCAYDWYVDTRENE